MVTQRDIAIIVIANGLQWKEESDFPKIGWLYQPTKEHYCRFGCISKSDAEKLSQIIADHVAQETKALREALEWLAPYAEVQVRLYPDATDTPDWQRLLDALANTAKGE